MLWLARVLDAHEEKDEREKAIAALRQEIADFDARVEDERLKVRNRQTEAEKPHGTNRYSKDNNRVDNVNSIKVVKRNGNSAEYIIARLKRDAVTDTHAAALLGSIEAGDIKPYRAAIDMGWVKTPSLAPIRSLVPCGQATLADAITQDSQGLRGRLTGS